MVTPGYAPFEQYGGDSDQGPYTDLYAMGAVLFFAMTGRNPPDAIARMKIDRLDQELQIAIQRYGARLPEAARWAMSPKEKDRPQTVAEWRETLLPGRGSGKTSATSELRTVTVTSPPPARAEATTGAGVDMSSPETRDMANLLEQRDQLERAVKEKFQRVLTVMFTDLKGSTAIAEAQGDIAVRGMLKRYHDLVTGAVTSHKGTLVKTIGDGSLSHFEDALNACRAAAAIQRGMDEINFAKVYKTLLLARIGMHTGECLLEKNDVFGDVVNTAARFEGSANPGEILISEETYNAMSDKSEFYTRFDRDITLKGKSLPFKAYIVFWNPKEIELDRARPAEVAKPSTPAWKIATWIGVPLLAILAAAYYITAGDKFGGETTRSINYSVPTK
jgi:class 3 adenylate cyclase